MNQDLKNFILGRARLVCGDVVGLVIVQHRCRLADTRGDYDGQPLSRAELRQLEQAGTGDGLGIQLLMARSAMESVMRSACWRTATSDTKR